MAISNIVLRSGVGPTATIALFVTHGLGSGAAVVTTDTHDGFKKKKPRVDDEELARIGRELRAKEQERLAEKELLRQQLQTAIRGEEIPETVAIKPLTFIPYDNSEIELLQRQLKETEMALSAIHEEIRRNAIRARQARDEHEIQIILQALTPTIH